VAAEHRSSAACRPDSERAGTRTEELADFDPPAIDEATGRRWSFAVSRADIRKFAVSIGAQSPIHHDVAAARDAGFRDLVAPAYFFLTLGMALGRILPVTALRTDGLPADDRLTSKVVAGGSQVALGEPICAGDEVEVRVSELQPEVKQGASGRLTIYTVHRTYTVGGVMCADESYIRIGKHGVDG
jgi:acyl dehydratase